MNKYVLSGVVVGSALVGASIGYLLREEKIREIKYLVNREIEKKLKKKCDCTGDCNCNQNEEIFV